MINTVLLGRLNVINKTILEFLSDDENIQIQHWPVESLEKYRKSVLPGSIDVLIVDLKSYTQNPVTLIKYLKDFTIFKSIIAIHTLSSWRLAKLILDAGANGYLTQDTNDSEIIEAIISTNQGESFVRI
ncbi:MAG: hypothetical protein PVH63_12960 [Balneolaceae bacterium]|jgi:DNA-binding NarL/FixJ family response regulator